MSQVIAPTPTLGGNDTKNFLKEMKRPNTENENRIKQRIENSRHVNIF